MHFHGAALRRADKGSKKENNMAENKKAAAKQPGVKIRLFKDNTKYKGDVFVSVNGRNYQIRRGEEVEVPAEVAEVLEHSAAQDEITARRIEAAAEQAQ